MAARQAHWEKHSESPSIIRRPEVLARTGLSTSRLYQLMAEGAFPQAVALGARSVGWDRSLVDSWVAERLKNGAAEREARNPISPPQRRRKAKSNVNAEA